MRKTAGVPATSSTGDAVAGACSAATSRGSRSSGRARAANVFVSNDAVYTYAGPLPLRFVPDARFELGLDFAAPVRVTPLSSASRVHPRAGGSRDGRCGPASSAATISTASRSGATSPLPLQADGEDLGDVREVLFEAERDAVTVLV